MGHELGARLRAYRVLRSLSQAAFAGMIGVSCARVSNWESGRNRPDVDILARICEVLGVSPSELLDVGLPPGEYSAREKLVIERYRDAPEFHAAIHKLLGIDD